MKITELLRRDDRGFSLIELMVVTAIVGILVALATGSFKSYQARAKQAEMKTNLGAIGDLALSYRAEYDTFVTDWDGIGWRPKGITRYRYWYNSLAAANTPTSPQGGIDYSDPGSSATTDTFSTAAVGNIDNDNSTDRWLYNQNKTFIIQQNDVITP